MGELNKEKTKNLNTPDVKVKIKKNPKTTSEIVADTSKNSKPEDSRTIDLDTDNLIVLSQEKQSEIEEILYKEISETISKDAGVRAKLQENHEIYEGIPARSTRESNSSHFDLDDSPGIRSHFGTVAVQGKVHRYIAAMFGQSPWITVNMFSKKNPKEVLRLAENIQEWLQVMLEKVVKLKKYARMLATNTGIEDTGISSLTWERRTDPERGVESFSTLEEFKKEYPSAEESGISQEQYDSYINALTPVQIPTPMAPPTPPQETSPDLAPSPGMPGETPAPPVPEFEPVKPISIRYKKYKITYDFCRVDIVNRSKFGLIPYNATFEKARGKFIEIDMTWNELAKGYSESRYKNIDRVKSRANSNYNPNTNEVQNAQSTNEGKPSEEPSTNKYNTMSYKAYRVLYSIDIDGDGLEELCIFLFAYNQKTLLRAEYWDKNWFLTPHYIEEKANRFEGIGIIAKARNVILEDDDYVNLRMKAGKLAVTPSFKAKKGSSFDPGLQYFYPGVIWWLDDMNEVEQWLINVNLPEGYNEDASLERKYELLTGMTSGQSGRELPQDPNAPGNKTAMLLAESSVLINGDIDVFRGGIETLVYNIITMASKYLPEDDRYLEMFDLTKEDLDLAQEEISLFGTSLSHNPDQRRADESQFAALFLNNPVVQMSMESMRKITYDAMEAWNKDADKILPTEEQLFEKQVEIQAAAMKKVQTEILEKQEEDKFVQGLMDEGLSQERAQARLKQFKGGKAGLDQPVTDEGKEELKTAVPM